MRYLLLSIEIRNSIYAYCFEWKCISIRHKNLSNRRSEIRGVSCDWPPGQFYALTQVCRQTRREFAPLYYQNTNIIVRLQDLAEFSKAFIATTAQMGPRNIKIHMCSRGVERL
jgi:hypothetical protein